MGLSVRQFVESLSSHSILTAVELSNLKGTLNDAQQETDAETLVRQLVQQGKLTKFQAVNLYQGRGKGLTFGEYVVLDKLGAGGMGQVFKAQHRRMKRVVALKVLPPHAVNSQKAIQRFYQEVEVAAKLTHPNIVTAYDAGEQHGMHFLVMEYVEGQDLSSYVNKNGPLGVEQCINVVLQAARGLAYAHGLGIIHRDIKPANLLIDRAGIVKVLDMGLARIDNPLADAGGGDELTASGEVMGTVDYMAPEQAQDTRTADHRTDIYALGCSMYRMLVGKPPYPGETTVQKILAHRDLPIPSLTAARADVPEVLDKLFKKMLAKNVAERTPTMAAVIAGLEKLLAGTSDERSSIVIGSEVAEAEEPNFNFLDRPAGASNVALGESPAGAVASPGKSGAVRAPIPTAASSGVIPRALPPTTSGSGLLPPSVAGAAASGIAKGVGTGGGAGSTRAFPTVGKPSTGGKIAKAKRLDADTDSGGKTQPALGDQAGSPARGLRDRRVQAALVGCALLAAVGAYFVFFRSPGELPQEIAAVSNGSSNSAVGGTSQPEPVASESAAPQSSMPQSVTSFLEGNADSIFGLTPTATETGTAMPQPPEPTAVPVPDSSAPPESMPSPPVTAPPPVAIKPSGPLTSEVDLLAMIEPEKTAHHSTWMRDGVDIVCTSNAGPAPRVLVPFVPPDEYDLTCTTIGQPGGIWFGPGIVFGGRQGIVGLTSNQCGIGSIDGKVFYQGDNPTYWVQENLVESEKSATVVCAVRRDRVYVEVNGKPVNLFAGSATRLSVPPEYELPPGQLFLHCNQTMRFQRLSIGPPKLKTPVVEAAVNLAARFDDSRNLVDGQAVAADGAISITPLAGKNAKIAFDVFRPESYVVTAVVERTAGEDFFGLGLPLYNSRRIGAMIDWGVDKHVGLQHLAGNPANTNATARKAGFSLVPGAYHVVRAEVRPEPPNFRVRVSIDGRQMIDYLGNDFSEGTETQVLGTRALTLVGYISGWNVSRLEVRPADYQRLPVPATDLRETPMQAVRTITDSASAKGAKANLKRLAVASLRREAATRLDDPAFRYAALDEAIRLGVEAADLSAAFEAAEDLCGTFDVDDRSVQQRVVEIIKVSRAQADAKNQLTAEALLLADRAAKSENFEWAGEIAAALDKLLGTSNQEAKRELKARTAEYTLALSLRDAAREAETKPAANADDAAAHAALGKYLCFGLGDWTRGLKELARGDDAGLKAAAALESGDTTSGKSRYDIAESWMDLSEQSQPPMKWYYLERATTWYRRAAPLLDAKSKAPLERRKTQIAQQRKASNGIGGARRPLDAQKIGDRWYKFYPSLVTWQTAADACERLGGSLLVVESQAENDAVAQYLRAAARQDRTGCWLGISDAATEQQFLALEGQPIAYANWTPGQPDNAAGVEDFGYLEVVFQSNAVTATWQDLQGTLGFPFICEWDH